MTVQSSFNKATEGYGPSAKGIFPGRTSEIMDRSWGADISPSLMGLSGSYNDKANIDPFSGQQQQTLTESLIKGNTREESLSEMMRPNKSYQAPKVDAGGMMRNANKVVTDGAQVSKKAGVAMEQTKDKIADFKADWKQAKGEALETLKQTAKDMDIDPKVAADSLIPDTASGKASALAYMGAEAATAGLGSMATFGKCMVVGQAASKQDRELPLKEQEALLKATLAQLQSSSPAQQDTRMAASAGPAVDSSPNEKSQVSWENLEMDDLAEFFAADPEGEDQPELKALRQTEHDLTIVQDNLGHVAENYHKSNIGEKIGALASTGRNHVASDLVDQATVPQDMDAGSVLLAGASVGGIAKLNASGMASNDAAFANVTDISTKLDQRPLNTAAASVELQRDIGFQLSA